MKIRDLSLAILGCIALFAPVAPAQNAPHVVFVVDKIQTVGRANANSYGIFGTNATSTSTEFHTGPNVTVALISGISVSLPHRLRNHIRVGFA
jgi:hypothetical protein